MKMTPENIFMLAIGGLVAYVVYVNVTGKKDPKIDYTRDAKFQNPLAK